MYVCVCVVAAGGGWFKGGVGDEERLEVTEVLQERSWGGGEVGGGLERTLWNHVLLSALKQT